MSIEIRLSPDKADATVEFVKTWVSMYWQAGQPTSLMKIKVGP
jgi:hypothetical protein